MSTRADDVSRQSPTPAQGGEGSDLRSVANRIEGLLDDDGHFNPNPEQVSRGHPDYDESTDERAIPDRDERGRFKAAEAPEEDETDLAASDDQDAAGDDLDADTEQPADDAAAGDTDEDLAASAVDEAETDDAETADDIQTLSQLAEALEVGIDDLKSSLTHTFNAADEEVTVTLQELEAGYQKDADYRRQTGKLAEDRRAAEQDYQLRMQQFDQQHLFLANQFNATEQLLAAELNDPRLAQLRESDPAEWTARREEIGQRVNALRTGRQQAAQQYDGFRNQQRAELKQREQGALMERMPDFSSGHVQIARGAMESLGYQTEEIAEIFDHRLVLGALELAALRSEVETLRAEKSKAADAVKRVKKDVPKLQKPGKQQMRGKTGVKRDNVARLKERAKKSGTVDDAARVIETMIQ